MSGHSKWHSIKHKKGAADAKRGKLFAVLIRQIEIAARSGGGDQASNATLRSMVQKARDNSLPVAFGWRPSASSRATGLPLRGVSGGVAGRRPRPDRRARPPWWR